MQSSVQIMPINLGWLPLWEMFCEILDPPLFIYSGQLQVQGN